MKNLTFKKILAIIIIAILICFCSSTVFAFANIKPNPNPPGADKIIDVAGMIIGVIQIVALAVAVIMLLVLAMKYMTAAPGEKADIKKSLSVYVIGAVILFAGAGVLEIIEGLAVDINKGVSEKPTTSQKQEGTYPGGWVV